MKREIRTKDILLKKIESLKDNIFSIKDAIRLTIDELSQCLDILAAKDEDMAIALDDEEIEEFRNTELREIRLDSIKEGTKVHENNENKVLFDTLRELYKVLVTKHLASIQEWISVLIRVEVEDIRFKDSALKDFIDIKNIIYSTKQKCEESGCDFPKIPNGEEGDIWEDGTIETPVNEKSGPIRSQNHDTPSTSATEYRRDLRRTQSLSNGNEKKNCDSESDPLRGKLLAEAPILNWGSFLHNWGSNSDVLANQKGLDLESHWGRVDQDAVIPFQKIAELNVRASFYKEDPLEIQPCRACLPNGSLCQRRDLKLCPFHGPIIQRDDEGNPISKSPLEEETAPESHLEECDTQTDGEIVERLLKQAVKNVQERDVQEANRKKSDKKTTKKAKLAKVREHNEAVLKDAAIASTWRSSHVGEDSERGSGSRSCSTKSEKQKLAAMLKKKETSKDRLNRRLLNGRAKDSTIKQLTVAEEEKYREAFPNQW